MSSSSSIDRKLIVALFGLFALGTVQAAPIELNFGFQNRASYTTGVNVVCTSPSGPCTGIFGFTNVTPLVVSVNSAGEAQVTALDRSQGDPSWFFTGISQTFVNFQSRAATDLTGTAIKKNSAFASMFGTLAAPWTVTAPHPTLNPGVANTTYSGTPRAFTQGRSTWADDLVFQNAALNGTPGSAVFHFALAGDAPVGGFYNFVVCSDANLGPLNFSATSFCTGSATEQSIHSSQRQGTGTAFSDGINVTLNFIYGTPVRLVVSLQAALEHALGTNDMFNSADLTSVFVAAGTTVQDGTGTGFELVFPEGPAPVPVPGTLALLIAGLLGLRLCRRTLG